MCNAHAQAFDFLLAVLLASTGSANAQGMGPGPGMVHSTGGGGCSQATTFLARTSLAGSDVTNYTNLICGMVTDGLITGDLSTTGAALYSMHSIFSQRMTRQTRCTTFVETRCTTFVGAISPETARPLHLLHIQDLRRLLNRTSKRALIHQQQRPRTTRKIPRIFRFGI